MPTLHMTYHEVSNELVHGVERANTAEVRRQRRAFIDELKKHILVQSIKDETAELAGTISGSQAAKGMKIPLTIS